MLGSRSQMKTAILLGSAALLLVSCARDPEKAKAKYLAAGQKYMKQKQYGDASIEFRNAIRLDPRFVDAYYQLSQADLAQHDWQAAYAALEKAIDLDPGRVDVRLDRGRLYVVARQFDKAEEEAEFILKQEPNNVAAYQLLGAALIGQQKQDRALDAFSKIAELRPNDPNTFINLALVEISLHRNSDAELHLKKALAVDPKSVQANLDLANFYHLQNRIAEAEQVLETGIQNSPESASLYTDLAGMLLGQGKATEADALCDRLRAHLPNSAEAAISIGDYYAQRRELEKALFEYRRGLAVSANNVEIKKRMEELYLLSGRTEEASALDIQLAKQAPKDVFVNILHGRLLLAQGKQQDAIIALQNTVKGSPDSAPAHYYLALAYRQNGNMGQAESELQETVRVTPGFPLALQSLAQLNISQNHLTEAQAYARELVHRFPADVNYRSLLGGIYLLEGQSRLAEEQFSVAKQLDPHRAAVHLELGQVFYAEKKWTEAEKEFETAIQLEPSDPTMLSAYSDFQVARQQTQKAVARTQQFVDANPNNASGHVILGTLQFDSKNTGAAQAEFERAIQIDPKNFMAYLRLGKIYEQENQTDAAIAQYQQALDLQPKSAALITMVGNLYLAKNDLERARKYYARALEADPNFAVANGNLAWVDAEEGKDLDVALGLAQKAKSLMPEVPSISDTLAWVMYKRDNYAGAVPILKDCVQKAPDSPRFRYHLGMALLGSGQKLEAKENLEAALRMKLDSSDAEKARQALAQLN